MCASRQPDRGIAVPGRTATGRRHLRPGGPVVLPLPDREGTDVVGVARLLRGLPGLAVLESARPGRRSRWSYVTADPVAVVDVPGPRRETFRPAREALARMAGAGVGTTGSGGGAGSPFTGGLVGYLSYDLGRELERLPTIAVDDQDLPVLRLGLYAWIVAIDRMTGRAVLAGRPVDGDDAGLRHRLDDVRARLDAGAGVAGATSAEPGPVPRSPSGLRFRSGLEHAAYEARVAAVREAIASGEIYQANLTRRLEAPFEGDPWPVFERLRAGDPATFAAYLDLGRDPAGARRAILSASPEPFLAVDARGRVATDPIKGTRPRGRTRTEDRALAAELLASAKDRAENVMIVDVLRNDLGRACVPGSVRVPRLCRLERTSSVQHLVSTVTGVLAPGADAFDLLAASFPGGSITGAPKIRAMEIIEELEPVRRGPYCGAALWAGPDGAMGSSILIRTFVADGSRLTLHVGGGITGRSDPTAEWEETRVKARGPLRAIGAEETDGQLASGPSRIDSGSRHPSHVEGIPSRPTAAATTPPVIAAVVSRSPSPETTDHSAST